jgi:hypothetical protein
MTTYQTRLAAPGIRRRLADHGTCRGHDGAVSPSFRNTQEGVGCGAQVRRDGGRLVEARACRR